MQLNRINNNVFFDHHAHKESLRLVGNNLDVVSLAKASMVSKTWKSIFGDHPIWKNYCLGSYEYRIHATHFNEGSWRVLYGELHNKCNAIIRNKWKIEKYTPGEKKSGGIRFHIDDCFFVNEKLVMLAMGQLVMREDQFPPDEKRDQQEQKQQKYSLFKVKSGYTTVSVTDSNNDFHNILSRAIDKNFLYASTGGEKNVVFCWDRNQFPYGCSEVVSENTESTFIKVNHGIIYLYNKNSVLAKRGSETLWEYKKEQGGYYFEINDTIGAFIDGDMTLPGANLFIWDARSVSKPKMIGGVKNCFLLGKEIISIVDDEMVAYSLKGMRAVGKIDCRNLNRIIPNAEQGLLYLLTENRYLTTFCIHGIKKPSRVDLGKVEITSVSLFNGILYCVTLTGRLLIIHPDNGVIRKGPLGMFAQGSKITVHGGKILGINWKGNEAVVVHATDTRKIKNKKKK